MSKWIDAFLAAQDVERVRKAKASLYEECLATAAPAELRPPAEHEGKPLHWIESKDGHREVWWWRSGDSGKPEWVFMDLANYAKRDAVGDGYMLNGYEAMHGPTSDGYRYLGPAEPPDSSLNPYDPNSQLVLVHRADHLRDMARLALLRDRLASVEAHNAELVAKYEALRKVQPPELSPVQIERITALHQRSLDRQATFPANAIGHAPKAVR